MYKEVHIYIHTTYLHTYIQLHTYVVYKFQTNVYLYLELQNTSIDDDDDCLYYFQKLARKMAEMDFSDG